MKKKRVLLGLAASSLAIATPVAAVVSCGKKEEKEKDYGKVFDKFDAVISKESASLDNWTEEEALVEKTNSYKTNTGENVEVKIKQLSNKFVDYIIDEINKAHMEEPFKIVHLDLSAYDIDQMGDYFWTETNNRIKLNTQVSSVWMDKKVDLQTSVIILNLNTTPLATHYLHTFDKKASNKKGWIVRSNSWIGKVDRNDNYTNLVDKTIMDPFLDNYLHSTKIGFVLLNNLETHGEKNESGLNPDESYGYQIMSNRLSSLSTTISNLFLYRDEPIADLKKETSEKYYSFITKKLFLSMYK
ncbi:hypothetical protein [Mycoplasma todarodis]|uniref:Lipoprotein n=1 Tax=Mycoplasma todarodis TaxID=1937191 RepID=A0A4R0XVU9_9MOLU|nr:hypothetical protein [Mycoplasma todarodis]TCG11081.1 hypothetical protein C4B25_02430 [Mycoplasma todarodis]